MERYRFSAEQQALMESMPAPFAMPCFHTFNQVRAASVTKGLRLVLPL